MKKIGLIFGSFNPIHIGHINIASNVINKGLVNTVEFVVAAQNPWKEKQVPYIHRTEMVKLATKDIIYADVSYAEISKGMKNEEMYTFETLENIKKDNKFIEYYIIVTQETYLEIPKWKNGEDILKNNNFIIVISPHLGEDVEFDYKKGDIIAKIEHDINISSTDIRKMISNNESLLPFVNKNVADYIYKNKLYC